MPLILHAFPPSPRAFKVLLVANHLGIDYTLKVVNLAAGDQRTPEHTKLNVNQRMPVLEKDGYVLWESNAILEYLAAKRPQSGLMPSDLRPRLQVAKWLYWESAHWDQACAIIVFENVVKAVFGLGEASGAEVERGRKLLHRLAKILDAELSVRPYVAGEALTIADFSIAAPLCLHDRAQLKLDAFPNVARWMNRITALPAWHTSLEMQSGG